TRLEGTGLDARAAGSESGCRSVGFNKGEHLLSVARDLDASPLAPYHALVVDDEGAAFDAAHLAPVHVLHLHDAELLAHLLALVRQQLERKPHLLLEALVGIQAVARHPVHRAAGLDEPGMQVAELRPFQSAPRGAVLGIEVQDYPPGVHRREPEFPATGGGQCEVAYRFIGHPRYRFLTVYAKNFTSSSSSSAGASSGR